MIVHDTINKKEKAWSILGLVVLLASFLSLLFWIFLNENHDNLLIWMVVIEGAFLLCILVLYISQFQKIRSVNAEKDAVLHLLENRMVAIEAAADGIGIVSPHRKLVYMNRALKDLYGITEDEEKEYLGQPWLNLYGDNDRLNMEDEILPELYEDSFWRGEMSITCKNGRLAHTEMSLTVLPDNSIVGTIRDISKQKQAEADKQDLEQQFYQAQKMEAVGRLAGGMAHDFNNVLAAIRGYAEFLDEDLEDRPAQKTFAQNILKACVQAKDLIDQILAFSRQKQGDKEAINVYDSVQEALSLLTASLPRTIELKASLDTKDAFINGNATQLSQIIMNLCVNAKDAIEDEHGELVLSLGVKNATDLCIHELLIDSLPDKDKPPKIGFHDGGDMRTRMLVGGVVKDQDYVSLQVSDTGTGMSRAIMERVFEPFFTTKPVNKGTGLGLSMIHGVVASHHGALILESKIGAGTSFELLFPRVESVQGAELAESLHGDVQQGAHILLVEDQEEVQLMMIQMLERMGYDVDACFSGLEGLEVMRDSVGYYDLIITDHNMPKMTGLEMIQQISFFDENVPFILLSGYSMEKMQEMICEHPSVKAVLRKPVAKAKLQDKITQVLNESRH